MCVCVCVVSRWFRGSKPCVLSVLVVFIDLDEVHVNSQEVHKSIKHMTLSPLAVCYLL